MGGERSASGSRSTLADSRTAGFETDALVSLLGIPPVARVDRNRLRTATTLGVEWRHGLRNAGQQRGFQTFGTEMARRGNVP